MNTLLLNPESPLSFGTWGKTFGMSGARALTPPLGLLTVAALLPREWCFRLVDLNARRIRMEDWDWADQVLITGMIVQRESLLELIRTAKRRGKRVVVGGPLATSTPEPIIQAGADFVIRGEGESAVPPWLAALQEGCTRGAFEETDKPDLTSSPVPRFDLVDFDDYVSLGIQTCRGCPFDCEFCDIVNLFGRIPRHKSPDQVIAELEMLYRLGWRGDVFINDDNFIASRHRARALLQQLTPWHKAHGEPFVFSTQVSVNLGQDVEMIDLMTEANFVTVLVGIETPDEDVLERVGKNQNVRYSLLESVRTLNLNGLTVLGTFILGLDGEKTGTGRHIADFIEESNMPVAMINTLQAVPNTRLWERLRQEGRLLENRTSGGTILDRPNFIPSRPESEIMREYLDAWNTVYEPSRFLRRTYRYFSAMRPTRRALAERRGDAPTDEPCRASIPARQRCRAMVGACRFFWWQGLKPPYRGQFWRQAAAMWRRNPSRLVAYLRTCALGENMFSLRDEIHRLAREDSDCDKV